MGDLEGVLGGATRRRTGDLDLVLESLESACFLCEIVCSLDINCDRDRMTRRAHPLNLDCSRRTRSVKVSTWLLNALISWACLSSSPSGSVDRCRLDLGGGGAGSSFKAFGAAMSGEADEAGVPQARNTPKVLKGEPTILG